MGSAIDMRSTAPVFVARVVQMSITEITPATLCAANDETPIIDEKVMPC